jgi:hypothetical protein
VVLVARRASRGVVRGFFTSAFPMITGQKGFLWRPGTGVKGDRLVVADVPFDAFLAVHPLMPGTGCLRSMKAEKEAALPVRRSRKFSVARPGSFDLNWFGIA